MLLSTYNFLFASCILNWGLGKLQPPKQYTNTWRIREVTQSCLTLCDPMDCSLPGSSVHGTFQALVLEWIAISFSKGSSQPRDWTRVSRIVDRCFTVWATNNGDWIKGSQEKPVLSSPGDRKGTVWQGTKLFKTTLVESNTRREKWATMTTKVSFNANDEFYFNASHFVRTCWTSIQNTVYYSSFQQKSWAGNLTN